MLGKMKLFFTHGKKVLVIISKKHLQLYYVYIPNILFHTSEYIGRYLFISMPAYSNHKLKKSFIYHIKYKNGHSF